MAAAQQGPQPKKGSCSGDSCGSMDMDGDDMEGPPMNVEISDCGSDCSSMTGPPPMAEQGEDCYGSECPSMTAPLDMDLAQQDDMMSMHSQPPMGSCYGSECGSMASQGPPPMASCYGSECASTASQGPPPMVSCSGSECSSMASQGPPPKGKKSQGPPKGSCSGSECSSMKS
jgi:hypothetical protein